MRAGWIGILIAILPWTRGAAQGATDPRYQRALGTLYTTAQLGGLVKAWCDARAPETRAVTDTALAAWKSASRLDEIEARADTVLKDQLPAIRASVEARRASVFRALDRDSKAPGSDCLQMRAYLDRSANPSRLHPAELRLVLQAPSTPVGSTSNSSTPAAPPRSGETSVPVVGRGTVFTVAQLSALKSATPYKSVQARFKQLGPLTVTGTLEAYTSKPDATVWFNTVRNGFRSTASIKCYDMGHIFRQLYNANRRDLTIRGTVREVDNWIALENCQIVTNVAGLTPSTLSDSGGLFRAEVAVDSIRTPPNGGATMAQIEGMYQSTELKYNPLNMLYDPDESTYLLMTDGWLYDELRLSPHDLNVAASRRLEPQHWHRWRRAGTRVEMQKYDDFGRTDGTWKELKASARPTIGTRRLNGVFSTTSSATAGLVGGGGAVSVATVSFTFRPDGRFSWNNFSQMFASSSSGTGDGGSTIVVGGTTVGPSGTFSSSVGGGDDEGTYTTDGYTLELRTRSGRVIRYSIFSWDSGKYRDFLVINGTTYSPPK